MPREHADRAASRAVAGELPGLLAPGEVPVAQFVAAAAGGSGLGLGRAAAAAGQRASGAASSSVLVVTDRRVMLLTPGRPLGVAWQVDRADLAGSTPAAGWSLRPRVQLRFTDGSTVELRLHRRGDLHRLLRALGG